MLLPQAAAAVPRWLSLGLAGRGGRLPVRALLPLVPAPGPGLLGRVGAGAQRNQWRRRRQQRVLALAQKHSQEEPPAPLGKETEERPGEGRRCRKLDVGCRRPAGKASLENLTRHPKLFSRA